MRAYFELYINKITLHVLFYDLLLFFQSYVVYKSTAVYLTNHSVFVGTFGLFLVCSIHELF